MAMIRPETEMKDSGVQWLGNIPKEWSVGKVKHEFYATKTIVGDKVNDYERLALTLNGVIKRSKDAGDGLQPEKFDGYQILKEHELVFKLIDLANVSTSRVGLSPYTGIVSPAYIVLHHRKDMNPRYGEYYFLSMWMNEVFNHIGGDGVRSALNAKDLLNIPYLKVSPDEQQAIADYLDKTCSKIDEIIAEAKASIDEYKELNQSVIFEVVTKGLDKNVEMKDSKIEQIGKIPQNWSVMRIKNILFERNERTVDGHEEKLSVTQQYGIVKSSEIQIPNPSDSFDGYRVVSVGDIVFNKYKAHSGVFFASPYDGIVTFNYSVYRCYGNQNPIYYEYLFHTQAFIDEFKRRIYGVGESISPLYSKNLLPIPVIVPPLVEQNLIVDYIKKKTQQIDSLISEKESLINDLEAYKKSLIYEVVTGKRRVV